MKPIRPIQPGFALYNLKTARQCHIEYLYKLYTNSTKYCTCLLDEMSLSLKSQNYQSLVQPIQSGYLLPNSQKTRQCRIEELYELHIISTKSTKNCTCLLEDNSMYLKFLNDQRNFNFFKILKQSEANSTNSTRIYAT